jgi:hypothetical protein
MFGGGPWWLTVIFLALSFVFRLLTIGVQPGVTV